jgi:restriction system protein
MASSENQVPSFDRLMWPAICALKQMGGSASHQELLDKVIEIAQIPEDAQSVAHTTGRESRIGYNLSRAQSYLGKYGALENTSRGVWALTAKGRRLKEHDIKDVVAAVRKMNQVKRRSGNGAAEPEGVPETGGGWKDELIGVLQGMTADAFERLCQRILRESGFLKVAVTGRSGDGGIDGVGVLRVALLSFQVYFQCKKWKGNVRAKDIRDFRGAMVGRRRRRGRWNTAGAWLEVRVSGAHPDRSISRRRSAGRSCLVR